MKELTTTVRATTGLHARPARLFVDTAKRFKSDIKVRHGAKTANGKSMVSMLTLGASHGAQVTLIINGADEAESAAALMALFDDNFGEPANGHANGHGAPGSAPAAKSGTNIGAAAGLAVGVAFRWQPAQGLQVIPQGDPASEQSRLDDALARADHELAGLMARIQSQLDSGEAAIFAAQRELLQDGDARTETAQAIAHGQSAAAAWHGALTHRADAIAALPDPVLAARASDVRDVRTRVCNILNGTWAPDARMSAGDNIIIAQDLSPSEFAALDKTRVCGVVLAAGSATSHIAILARAFGLPLVIAPDEAIHNVPDGTRMLIDGANGQITINPDEAVTRSATEAIAQARATQALAGRHAHEPALTRDGTCIEVGANAGGVEDARRACAAGADGIGLLRTEFLFASSATPPTAADQHEVYRGVIEAMQGRPVIVRTLDIGGDKPVPYLPMPAEANPFLGQRGIRLCLGQPELFATQLRAIAQTATVAPAGTLRVMLPMIADIAEFREARAILERERKAAGAPAIPLGIMIEVPSAALMADVLAREVDFFSIGTNDLAQYTLAIDRQHPQLASKADGLHPAVLRLIMRTIEAGQAAGKWVGVCGELASDPAAVPILLGLGVNELSVSPPAVALIKAEVRRCDMGTARALAGQALQCATAAEVRALCAAKPAA